ncbi:MAG: hypothetical protein ACREJB_06685, partial [Planctomycetaceae bacterium]
MKLSGVLCLLPALALWAGSSVVAEDGYGSVTGQFILQGEVPQPVVQRKKGDPTVKDTSVCAAQD